jgi:hypothetical protein
VNLCNVFLAFTYVRYCRWKFSYQDGEGWDHMLSSVSSVKVRGDCSLR